MRALLAFALLLLGALPAAAAEDDNWCRNGLFPSQQTGLGLATATAAPRTWFLQDAGSVPGCPQKGDACHFGYVVPGQTVLTGRNRGGFVCAFFPNKRGGTAGWIPASQLKPGTIPAAPPLSGWAGTWVDGDDDITFAVKGKTLSASGNAIWSGSHPDAPNVGDFEGLATPRGTHITFQDGTDDLACRVDATLVGPYLVVTDNSNCGGNNVRFDGVYQRTSAQQLESFCIKSESSIAPLTPEILRCLLLRDQ